MPQPEHSQIFTLQTSRSIQLQTTKQRSMNSKGFRNSMYKIRTSRFDLSLSCFPRLKRYLASIGAALQGLLALASLKRVTKKLTTVEIC